MNQTSKNNQNGTQNTTRNHQDKENTMNTIRRTALAAVALLAVAPASLLAQVRTSESIRGTRAVPRTPQVYYVMKGLRPTITWPKNTYSPRFISDARLASRGFTYHKQWRNATTRQIETDWQFRLSVDGYIPTHIRPGQSFAIRLQGLAGGSRMVGPVGAGVRIRTMGFNTRTSNAIGGGSNTAVFAGRAGNGTLYRYSSRTITLWPQGQPGTLRLTLVGPNGATITYTYERVVR